MRPTSGGGDVGGLPEVVQLATQDGGEEVLVAGHVGMVADDDRRLEPLTMHQVEHGGAAEPRNHARSREQPGLLRERELLGVQDVVAAVGEEALNVLPVATPTSATEGRPSRHEDPLVGRRVEARDQPRREPRPRHPDVGVDVEGRLVVPHRRGTHHAAQQHRSVGRDQAGAGDAVRGEEPTLERAVRPAGRVGVEEHLDARDVASGPVPAPQPAENLGGEVPEVAAEEAVDVVVVAVEHLLGIPPLEADERRGHGVVVRMLQRLRVWPPERLG